MKNKTSWQKASGGYDKIVGEKGHYHHQKTILPKALRLLKMKKGHSLLDLGCGSGVLARHIRKEILYTGVDASSSLIKKAKGYSKNTDHNFLVHDVTKKLPIKEMFTHASFILSLQNMEDLEGAIARAKEHLREGGRLLIVINHPCFRIPRQSSWEIDLEKKLQSRKVDRYLSPLKIPIQMHPGKKPGIETFSFHRSLSDYASSLFKNRFLIEKIEEWCSDKKSTGKHAKMEDRARKEFPLFLAILARKS